MLLLVRNYLRNVFALFRGGKNYYNLSNPEFSDYVIFIKSFINKPRILIANNDEISIPLFKSSPLEKYDYIVTIASSFSETYNIYIKQHFDVVILTNLGLSPFDILRYIRKFKEFNPEQVILVMSGYDDYDFINNLANLGVETFYELPIDLDNLHSRIKQLLNFNII